MKVDAPRWGAHWGLMGFLSMSACLMAAGPPESGSGSSRAASTNQAVRVWVVKADKINMRSQPSKYGLVLGRLKSGDTVKGIEFVEEPRVGDAKPAKWLRIELPLDVPCWISVSEISAAGRTVLPRRASVRSGPGESFAALTTLTNGTPVKARQKVGRWMRIEAPSELKAFVAADLVGPVSEGARPGAPPPAAKPPAPVVTVPASTSVPPSSVTKTGPVVTAPATNTAMVAAEAAPPISLETVVVPMVFPVAEGADWKDSFLQKRARGQHLGQDLMAPKMRPVVAAFDGTIACIQIETRAATNRWESVQTYLFNGLTGSRRRESERSRGSYIMLQGDNGWSAAYMHINNDTPGTDDGIGGAKYALAAGITAGARVFAGQLLGWVGDSGTAEETAPHCHFELRRGDLWNGVLYNAAPSLRAAVKLRAPRTQPEPPASTTATTGAAPKR